MVELEFVAVVVVEQYNRNYVTSRENMVES